MMNTDIFNTAGSSAIVYDRWVTAIGGDGTPPTVADVFENCHALRVVQSAGGGRLDYADLSFALEDFRTNSEMPSGFQKMVAVFFPDNDQTRVHLGDYVFETEQVTASRETLVGSSQMRSYHFGEPLTGFYVKSPLTGAAELIHESIVFNPRVDGKTRPNRSQHDAEYLDLTCYLFVHPESVMTLDAEAYQDDFGNLWTLRTAVDALCQFANGNEEFIRNPTSTQLTTLDDGPEIKDIFIPIGTRLPEALDRILAPLGYNWHVDYATGTEKPIIKFFKIGAGDTKQLYTQAPGSLLDLNETNLAQYSVSRLIGDAFNQVRVLGDYERKEVTLPLMPAWPEDDDDLTAADLDRSDEGSQYVGHELAWRCWVANEAGDIDSGRSFGALEIKVPDLQDIFTVYIPHRRQIEDPITYTGPENAKQRRPILVEYSTGVDAWLPVPESWPIKLMPDQIGVYFDGDQPPTELIDAGTAARVRITGTIAGDSRIEGLAEQQDWSVNGRRIEQLLMAPDKFFYRKRQEDGDYRSVFTSYSSIDTADEADDTDEISAYAEAVRDRSHYAEIDCEFVLPGLHLEYQIGDLISSIDGREINLDAAPSNAPDFRYPQIVERRFEFADEGPKTTLIVDRGIAPETAFELQFEKAQRKA
jgi:hypothetical protein